MGRSGDYPHTSETEEELQQRLMQLFNLPTQPVSTDLTVENSPPDIKETPQYITLDCNSLAESIASLPVHERLGLSGQLLELGGYSTLPVGNSNGDIIVQERIQSESLTSELKKGQATRNDSRSSSSEATQSGAREIQVGKTIEEQWQGKFDFNPHTLASTAVNTPQQDGENDSELDELLSESVAGTREGPVRWEESHSPPTTVTQEMDELDDMLDELLA